jgi:mono/diheme cytochrome c family protein
MKRKLLRALAVVAGVVVVLLVVVSAMGNKDFDAPLPGNIHASKDPAVIARGKYLAFGPAHCALCHTPASKTADVDKGLEMPLVGGWHIDIPPGKFNAPNITPDNETGIGKLSDAQLARALRYSVNHRNKAMFPFMPFQEMSDEDVVAVISFLRSQEPVKNAVPHTEYSLLGKALLLFGAIKPAGPKAMPPKSVAIDSTPAYGEYIATRVANCAGCHTNRDLMTGDAIGPAFAGGLQMPADEFSGGYTFVTPNLTPDAETGHIAKWNEATFIGRFRAGRAYKGSHMPWGPFSKMSDLELKAVYRFLQTLKPVKNKIEKVAYAPGEALPKA